jgi:hypothetical protein
MDEATLAAHLDRQAVVDVTIAYCWALDRNEYERLRDVFLPDATARLGDTECDGIDAIVARVDRALTPLHDSQHLISNHEVSIDGDTATSRCYLHAQHVARPNDPEALFVVAGRYEDQLVRTPAGWRIRRRVLTTMWTAGNPAALRRPG